MKLLSGIILGLGLLSPVIFTSQSFAGPACEIALEWEATPDSGVAGYALYYGPTGTPLTNRVDAANQTTTAVKGLTAATQYTFYVVAYDADQNEGGPSVPVYYTATAISSLELGQLANGDMKISFHVAPTAACRVEYTDSLSPQNWMLLTTATADSDGLVIVNDPVVQASRFYRGVAQ
jgi:hypothetical protein